MGNSKGHQSDGPLSRESATGRSDRIWIICSHTAGQPLICHQRRQRLLAVVLSVQQMAAPSSSRSPGSPRRSPGKSERRGSNLQQMDSAAAVASNHQWHAGMDDPGGQLTFVRPLADLTSLVNIPQV